MLKKVFLSTAILLGIIFLSACSEKTENNSSKPKEVVKEKDVKEIKVFSEIYEGSSITAFEQELIKEIAKVNNWKIEIVNTPWDDLFTNIKEDKEALVISGVTASEDRKKDYNFSDSYFKAYQLALTKEELKENNLLDLLKQNKIFTVQKETTAVYFLKELFGNDYEKVKEVDNFDQAVQEFFDGESDVFIADNSILLDYLKQNNKEGYKLIKDPKAPIEEWGIMIQKGNDELTHEVNEALKILQENGTYDTVYSKFFSE